jgi:nitrite reductase (NADH) small subunit
MLNTTMQSRAEARALANRVAIARAELLPAGQGRCFSIGGRKIAVFRTRAGRIHALDAACPHRGGPLADGIVGAGVVVCPLHAYRFRLEDGSGVDTECTVRSYPVEVVAGFVIVELPAD